MALSLTLRVGSSSGQDVALTSSGVMVVDYAMRTPDIEQTTIPNLGDGNSLGVPSWKNVTETIELHISAATAALVSAKVQAIEALLDLARQGSLGQFDDRLYLLVQFDNDSEAWRSQILAAKLESDNGTNQIWRKYVRAKLSITRRFYWETEASHALEVSSGTTTTATTGYAVIYNADDTHATQRNWFQIAAAQITGSIPSPAKISIKNTSGATRDATSFYIGNYVFCDPTNVDAIFRDNDAAASDTTPSSTEQNIYRWSLSANPITDDFKGQFARFVVVWSNLPANDTLLRPAITWDNTITLALGEMQLNSVQHYVQDLGALPLPPSQYVSDMGTNMDLVIRAKAVTSDTLGIDWLQLFPSGKGRYRVINGVANLNLASNDQMIDDGPNEATYFAEAISGANLPLYRPLFDPIYLWPGRINRLRVIISGGSNFEAGEVWGVSMSHRPRRLSF